MLRGTEDIIREILRNKDQRNWKTLGMEKTKLKNSWYEKMGKFLLNMMGKMYLIESKNYFSNSNL